MADNVQPNTNPQFSPPVMESALRTMTAEESRAELKEAIHGSNQVLIQANTVLDPFPNTMTVDRAKVTITKRSFFRIAEITSMRIEDVLNVVCSVGPFFGTVTLISRVMNSDQTISVGKFWRSDAKRLKRVTQGYVIALQRNIDCSALEGPELSRMLEKLGADSHQES